MNGSDPIIWKKTPCAPGDCKGTNIKHWWSIPFTAPQGLTTECFHCGKTRKIEVERNPSNDETNP